MADQRLYVVRSLFNGTTVATEAMAWVPQNPGLNALPANIRYRALVVEAVGLFSPALLGRSRTSSLIRVWADNPQTGDTVQILGSNVVAEAAPILWPRGAAIQLTAGPQSSTLLEANMTDHVSIITTSDRNVYIEVLDLGEEQHLKYELNQQSINTDANALTTETRVVAISAGVPYLLAAWTASVLFVDVTAAAPNDVIRLPLISSVGLGAKVRIFREAGEWFNIGGLFPDEINGVSNNVRMIADNMGAFFEATAEGWVCSLVADDTSAVPLSGTTVVPTLVRQRTRIEYTTGNGTLLQLPPNADSAVDQEVEVVVAAVGGTGGWVSATSGQALDGVIDRRVPLVRLGDTAIFRFVAPGNWISYTNGNDVYADRYAVVGATDLSAEPPWAGLRYYECTFAGAGNFTLPTAPKVGQEILFRMIGANVVTLQGGANVIVSAGAAAAALILATNVPIHLRYFTGGWIVV